MLKLHTYDIIGSMVKQVKNLSLERGFSLHAAAWASWGVGKTIACRQLIEAISDIYYLKFQTRQIEPSGMIKDILLSLGVGPTRGYLNNYDLLIKVLSARGITQPILIIDEAQLLFTKPALLSFLKDLSEDPAVGFSYIFLGDENLSRLIANEGHSIIKRIRIRVEIPAITDKTIQKLSDFHQVELPEGSFNIAKKLGATTMDIDFALFLAKKAKKETLTAKELQAFIKAAKRGQ